MNVSIRPRRLAAAAIATATVVALAGCSSSGSDDGTTEITILTYNADDAVGFAEAAAAAFHEEYPEYSVKVDTRPSGSEGDNLIKTRLSTGEMADVFVYNSGSLFQALSPDSTLTDLSDQEWVDALDDDFTSVVSTDEGVYGSPIATAYAGGVVYNKKVYEQLGLTVPTTWDEYLANNEAVKEAGLVPVYQSYADTWTSQVSILADFGNILAADPDWAEEYTANQRSYAEEPAFASWQHLQDLHDAGLFNTDYSSATFDDAVAAIAQGQAAHYPIVSTVLYGVQEDYPDNLADLGFFALPADDAENTRATIWQPDALYIPKTTEGAKLEAAKAFIDFVNSPEGCQEQSEYYIPVGPYVGSCELGDDVPAILTDIQAYIDSGDSAPALEFLSPIKGPNLESYTVEVGSGLRPAKEAAELYDQDVEKQAQQLGLEGW